MSDSPITRIFKVIKMGSWHATCGVSQLPITCGEDVVLFILGRKPTFRPNSAGDFHYPNALWEIIGLPIYAKYDDYGWVEEVQETQTVNTTMNMIRDHLIEREVGKNEYHDHAVKKDNINFETLGEIFHGDRLQFSNKWLAGTEYHPIQPIYYMMIHKDIFNFMISKIMGDNWQNQTIDDIKETIRKSCIETIQNGYTQERLFTENFSRARITDIKYLNQITDSEYFISEVAKIMIFHMNMDALRKFYSPQIGAGSQNTNFDDNIALAEKIKEVALKEESKYDYNENEIIED